MSTGIFDLDEDREQAAPSAKPAKTDDLGPTSPPHLSPTSHSPIEPTTTRPVINTLQLPQPYTSIPGHRRQTTSFAATPSFPSPLAQAITVPLNSDTSSSSSLSSEDERDAGTGQDSPVSAGSGTPRLRAGMMDRPRTVSPVPSRHGGSRGGSPSSTEKSISRPPSPSFNRASVNTPGSLLNKARRSTSGTVAASGSLPASSPLRDSPPRTNQLGKNSSAPIRRMEDLTRPKGKSHARDISTSSVSSAPASSGSSAFTYRHQQSPELYPADARSSAGSPTDTRDNTLGLGLGWGGGWDASSSSSSSFGGSAGNLNARAADDVSRSPRKEQESRNQPIGR